MKRNPAFFSLYMDMQFVPGSWNRAGLTLSYPNAGI